jgi:hypothetical protein
MYTTDQEVIYNRKAATDLTAQETSGDPRIGGALADAVHPPLPKSFKPRVALCQDAAGNKYRVVCYTKSADLYTTVGVTIDLFDRDGGAAITVTSYGSEGERSRNKLLTP